MRVLTRGRPYLGLLVLGVTAGDAVAGMVATHPWIALVLRVPAATVIGTQLIRVAVIRRPIAQ